MRRYGQKREELEDVALEDVRCSVETERAVLVVLEDGRETWVPKSCLSDDSEVYAKDHQGKLVVKGWFAAKQGWTS